MSAAENARVGVFAQGVARSLWPDLTPVPSGSAADLAGVDAISARGLYVQVKLDRRIAETGNLFWEVAKRGDGAWNAYGGTAWHGATATHEYVYVTVLSAYRVTVDALIKAIETHRLRPITRPRGTAFGFVIPLPNVSHARREHAFGFDADELVRIAESRG